MRYEQLFNGKMLMFSICNPKCHDDQSLDESCFERQECHIKAVNLIH